MTLSVCLTDFDLVHPAVGAIKLNFRIRTLDTFLGALPRIPAGREKNQFSFLKLNLVG
jgi:hypothetical protein